MRKILAVICLVTVISLSACSSVTHKDVSDLKDDNPITRQEAMERIAVDGQTDFPFVSFSGSQENARRAVELMVKLFNDCEGCADLRLDILSALAALGSEVELPTWILAEAVKHENPRIRNRGIETVAKASSPDIVPVLVEILEDDSSEIKDKYAIIWALGEIGGREAVSYLEELLHSEDKYIEYNAYQALERIAKNGKSGAGERAGKKKVLALGKITLHGYKSAMERMFKKIVSLKSVWTEI